MEVICDKLDRLTLEYLDEFGHLLTCKQLIDDTMKNGYFTMSRARVIMGVNNLSRIQYPEQDPMAASVRISMSPDSVDIEKHMDQEHANDALRWFGLLTPNTLKQSQKCFQQAIDLIVEACQRQATIERIRSEIEKLLAEKKNLSSKENTNDEDNKQND